MANPLLLLGIAAVGVYAWSRSKKDTYRTFGEGDAQAPKKGGVLVAADCAWATVSNSWWKKVYLPYVVDQAKTEDVTDLPVEDQPAKISLNAIESWFNNCGTDTPAGAALQIELEERARKALGIKG
jgi:hypothetical protein